uniref:Uncharacterized protein n=1 Tax=Dendroctonus ponderosae TaxID=77166 RepID=A0AAR5PBH5_DENPD
MLAARLRGDLNEEFFEDEDPKRQMAAALSKASLVLDGIEETLKDLIVNADVLEADTLIFNNDTQVNGLQVAAVNALEVDDVLDKVLDIAEGFSVNNSMNFTVVVTENSLSLSTLNGSPLEEYVSLRKDLMLEEFTVQGPVAFQSGLLIGNHTINDVEITEKNLLLKEGDQDFSENLSVDELRVNELTSNNLNCFALDSLSDNGEEIFNIGALKVKHLSIGGLLNNVDIKSLAKRGLRKSGNQFWETPLSFNSLEVEELQIKELSGKLIPQNLVPINAGQYHVHQDVTFTKDLRTNRLDAGQSLNNIAVKCNGLLDVLLIDSPEQQEIPARKSFTNLTLKRRYSPLIIDESPCEILNDLRINGSVKLSKRLKVRDLKPANSSGSMGEVLANGIKLTDVEMPVHLTFTQPLKVESIRVDKINSLDPNKWILGSSASPQVLTGHKQFWGDIHLKGPVNVANMNNIDVGALENHTLRVEGDQEIGGFWTVESLVANKGVLANKTQLPEGSRTSLRIKGDLEARVNTSEFTLQGLVNSNRLQDVLGNMVEKNTKYRVFGEKHFKDLHVQDLEIPEHSNISKLLRTVTSGGEITLKTDLDLFNNISIRRVQFKGRLNDLTRADFDGLMHLDSNPEETVLIPSDVKFKELVVLGEVFVADNSINGQNLTAIEQDTVKIDEDHVFHSGVFEETVTVGDTLGLNGSVENLDLDFIVLQNGSRMLEIADIVFNDTLVVNGTLFLHGTANGVDLRKFCTFSQQREKSLKIFGKENWCDLKIHSLKYVYSGSLLELTNATHFKIKAEFHRNSTESLTHFQSPASNQTCLAFIGQSLPGLDIYCYEAAQKSFYWAQRIDLDGIYKALAVEALDSIYLFLARHQHPLSHEPCIEVFQSTKKLSGFQPIQTIYEGVDLNGLAAATINGKPFVAFSFGYQESTVQSGRVTIRRLDLSSNQFKPLQDIPVPVPKGVHFITQASFEPLLLIQQPTEKPRCAP